LAAIAGSLYSLNLAECKIVECKQLYYCDRIETLNLKGNLISDLQEQVLPLLATMRGLSNIDLRENHVQKDRKYREQVIMTGRMLKELDGKTVR